MSGEASSNPESLRLSQLRRVDEVCDRFEAAWRAGQRPLIEECLALATTASERRELLCQLLELEIELRREDEETPTAAEYAARFPEHAETIQGVFQDAPRLGDATKAMADSGNVWGTEPPAPKGGSPSLPALPKYEVLAEVGCGKMGIVYHARHRILKKTVAIKVILPGRSHKRFLREAQLLATVRSPYVVAVHDFEVLPDGSPMLCMDWIQGQNLKEAMDAQGGRLAEDVALRWMREVCEGMEAAADQGVIHRDLKPSNILVDTRGQARVADFGLARGPEPTGHLSRTGEVMGTAHYMAPEQAEDPRSVDTRADI